jgi:uncharacterized protein (UPF0548 family)
MAPEGLLGPPEVRRKLARLADKDLNFDPVSLPDPAHAGEWHVTDLRQPLPGEPPGMPAPDGSWEIARRLMRGYEFADPSIVRAYYDPNVPLERRDMLLKLQALGLVHLFVGVRVGAVYEQTREDDGRQAHVWGWNYRTLEGHVEMGQMDWQIWKWVQSGEVEFRVHSISRVAHIANPVVALAFRLLRGHERAVFLDSTRQRMRTFVELALAPQAPAGKTLHDAAAEMTARPSAAGDVAHDALAGELSDGNGSG